MRRDCRHRASVVRLHPADGDQRVAAPSQRVGGASLTAMDRWVYDWGTVACRVAAMMESIKVVAAIERVLLRRTCGHARETALAETLRLLGSSAGAAAY